ncbi:MAG: septum site-determining protein MinC [Clostridiales bacterium]|jgi:septum site-determining protein MinC|nr:septum site-determining protein MinC [Clostridiales bacterium]
MKENKVFLKGILGGLQVYIGPDAGLESIMKELGQKLDSSKSFFKDTEVNLVFTGRELNESERNELVGFISQKIHVGNVEFNIPIEKEEAKMDAATYSTDEGMTKFYKGTVRNGQRIDYQGNIIVMGDVNPGAEIVAGGNIIVLGNLRGMAHAGVSGDKRAIVIALCLQPTQLRIGNVITRSPEDETEKPHYPEIAYLKGNNLFIEPYLPGKIKY